VLPGSLCGAAGVFGARFDIREKIRVWLKNNYVKKGKEKYVEGIYGFYEKAQASDV